LAVITPRHLQQLQDLVHRHRRSVAGTTLALLAGFALTAVAVAPLVPDAVPPAQRLVIEQLQPVELGAQLEALAALDLALVRSDITRGTDTIPALFGRLGITDAEAQAFVRSDATARRLLAGRGGKMVQARTDSAGALQELIARYPSDVVDQARTHFTRLTISRFEGRWLSQLVTVPFTAQARLASGTITSSLFAATDAAGVPDSVAMQLADIFSVDIDFHRELRRGDTFSVVYESLYADGEPVAWNEGAGRVLAAEFVNAGRAHHAVYFQQAGESRGGYYGLDGNSRRRIFLASPMEFSRITSGFGMRLHPLQRNWRQHRGVDYAAPVGTPVRAVGDGVVEFAGSQNGYGNTIEVRHSSGRSTLYAHLSKIDVRRGQRVEQGQRIGAVGMTGWTTGPHLHFEFRINGEHQDPLRIAKSSEKVELSADARGRFAEVAQRLQVQLEVADSLVSQRSYAE
jgi:murein DD-endopeptidase MepM/ murein hydrolase activator NlpD